MESRRMNDDKGKWEAVKIVDKHWAIYMRDYNTEYVDDQGDNLVFDTKKEAISFIKLLNIIDEAEKLGYNFTLEDAQDVLDTKPSWYHGVETEAEAVADYIDAYGE